MGKDAYITNPDFQQGEPEHRKGVRAPADINAIVQPSIPPEESVDEGPVPVPHHDKPGRTMGDKIGR
jgi:hypothetical protein